MMTEFQVKGYKSLADVKIPLTPIHVLIGQNDSGKTSVLEAMLALSRTTGKPFIEGVEGVWSGRDLVFHNAEKPQIEFSCQLRFGPEESVRTYNLVIEFPSPQQRYAKVVSESATCEGRFVDISNLEMDAGNSMLYAMSVGLDTDSRRSLERIKETLAPAHHYRLDAQTMALPASLDPNRRYRMERDGFGLSTLIDDIMNDDRDLMNAIEKEFCGFFPEFKKIRLTQSLATKRIYQRDGSFTTTEDNGKVVVFVTRADREVRAEQASDGALLFLSFLALTHLPKPPKLLLIEEPENGIYPKRLEELVRVLKQHSEQAGSGRSPQIILTTHSPYLISSFTPEEVTLMRREADGSSQAYPLRDSELIRENLPSFYLGEVWFNFSEDQIVGDAEYAPLH